MFKKELSVIKLLILKIKYGKRLKIKTIRQFIRFDTEIVVGKNAFLSLGKTSINSNVHIICEHGELNIGNRVAFNCNCIISCRYRVKIGDNCLFGPNVCLYDDDHAFDSDGVSAGEFECSEIIIEDGCWIGAGVIILRGTHIGRNSVIGAGTVVKGNIPPNSLVFSSRETKTIPLRFFKNKRKQGSCAG